MVGDLYTINDVCRLLKVHHNTVRRWIWSGRLLAHQPGRMYLIPKSALEDFLTTRPAEDWSVGPSISLREVYLRDQGICHLCGEPVDILSRGADAAERDHVIPKSEGGSQDADNIRLSHRRCNRAKGPAPFKHLRQP